MSLTVDQYFTDFSPTQTYITPFKSSVYLMMAKLSEIFTQLKESDAADESTTFIDELCDRRSYYSALLWTLLRGPEMSLPILKCFIHRYMDDFDGFFQEFVLIMMNYEKKEVVPNNKEYFDPVRCTFLKPLSLFGFFIERFSEEYNSMNSTMQFKFALSWAKYLDSPATQEEIEHYSAEWKVDVNEMLVKVVQLEESIKENARKSKRNVFYNKPNTSSMEVD
ncbi:unnamed protein product [Bursaphelenchus xylophilus]|uniref:(pine wood nematode) hypothetical protein n=1 Tax=Bursaphelenchus xylophilus TaxID=6326 RepID=A0A1I7S533_BURXY|nr:unnamed protein product [Bursaphelenchus xylophilus]CAG9117651.1 unnamed protein product [Bursaphelenchus xylophilus]